MKGSNWSLLAVLVVVLCHFQSSAAPSVRVKREDELSLDPISAEVIKKDMK